MQGFVRKSCTRGWVEEPGQNEVVGEVEEGEGAVADDHGCPAPNQVEHLVG